MNKPNSTSLSIPDLRNHSSNQSSKPIILKNSYVTWGVGVRKVLKSDTYYLYGPQTSLPQRKQNKVMYFLHSMPDLLSKSY